LAGPGAHLLALVQLPQYPLQLLLRAVGLLSSSGTLSTQPHHLLTQLARLLVLLLGSLAQLVKLTPCSDEGCLQLQGKGSDKQQQERGALGWSGEVLARAGIAP
jgi:hypothetical protein